MPAIDAQHLRKSFGGVHALRDVSLSVETGSIVGFLGPNGAGKTTTLRGLIGMLRFDDGEVRVLGHDPWRDRVRLHEAVGYAPGGGPAFPHLTGEEFLDHAAALTTKSGRTAPLRRRALDAVRLTTADLRRPVTDYSKGMRQKVVLVQALQHDPELLLLDEPSEGLDPLVQHDVYELWREHAARGRTVLLSSHTLSEVDALCDRVAIVRAGSLVIESSLSDLRRSRPRIVRVAAEDVADLAALDGQFERLDDDHAGRAVYRALADANAIVGALTGVRLRDVVIEEPSLEDIFRSYYASGDAPDEETP